MLRETNNLIFSSRRDVVALLEAIKRCEYFPGITWLVVLFCCGCNFPNLILRRIGVPETLQDIVTIRQNNLN